MKQKSECADPSGVVSDQAWLEVLAMNDVDWLQKCAYCNAYHQNILSTGQPTIRRPQCYSYGSCTTCPEEVGDPPLMATNGTPILMSPAGEPILEILDDSIPTSLERACGEVA